MKISYYYNTDKFSTVLCGSPEEIRSIMQVRVDFLNISNYNNFYFSENGDKDDSVQFWVEANGNYAYLYYIDGDYQYQSLNDDKNLDPYGETAIIPGDPVYLSNTYFVTIETAINAAIEFCETKSRPTNLIWDPMQEE